MSHKDITSKETAPKEMTHEEVCALVGALYLSEQLVKPLLIEKWLDENGSKILLRRGPRSVGD